MKLLHLSLLLEAAVGPAKDVLVTNDAIVTGLLLIILATVFVTANSSRPFFKQFYKYVPALLLCYFLPSLLTSFGIVDPGQSQTYAFAKLYLLPTSLVLLTLSIDFKGIIDLGPKAIIMFLAGTLGIVIGGPIAIFFVAWTMPGGIDGVGVDELWRGFTTVAGSWIGGGANQTAMKEVFNVNDELFSAMILVDVLVANLWMAFLLIGAGRTQTLDTYLKADSSAVDRLTRKMETFRAQIERVMKLPDLMLILAVGFGVTAFAHVIADTVAPYLAENHPGLAKFSLTSGFFWLIVVATTGGLVLSFTKFRKLEGVGASTVGSAFIYVLVATIGLKMDIGAIFEKYQLFAAGIVWMMVHVVILFIVAKLIKAPFFFVAVGSQANVGGAASAPVVAAAFHQSLAPVGVLLAVLGYALGTYAAWLCGIMMSAAAG